MQTIKKYVGCGVKKADRPGKPLPVAKKPKPVISPVVGQTVRERLIAAGTLVPDKAA